jgi:hypothetical protein
MTRSCGRNMTGSCGRVHDRLVHFGMIGSCGRGHDKLMRASAWCLHAERTGIALLTTFLSRFLITVSYMRGALSCGRHMTRSCGRVNEGRALCTMSSCGREHDGLMRASAWCLHAERA